jgi:rieske iron-sulfur protein
MQRRREFAHNPSKYSRHDFLKLFTASGIVFTFASFVDWSEYLYGITSKASKKQKVELPDGSQANLKTFPINHCEVFCRRRQDYKLDLTIN